MELWVKNSSVHGYADDTSTSVAAQTENEVIQKLEADAKRMLRYLASNSLSANPNKTGFMIIRTSKAAMREIKVGNANVQEETCHRILGFTINNTLTWQDHVNKELKTSLNRRIGALKRIAHHIPKHYLPQIASAIVGSKIRYGISIYGSVRLSNCDPQPALYHQLQVSLNSAMSVASGYRRSDRISIQKLSEITNIKSVNQMAAEDSLMLMWQSLNGHNSPLLEAVSGQDTWPKNTRAKTRGDIRKNATTNLSRANFPHKAISLWNSVDPTLRSIKEKRPAKTFAI